MTSATDVGAPSIQDLWSEWDIVLPQAEADAHLRALEVLRTWLSESADQPARAIRAVQTLMLNPQTPGLRARGCFKELRQVLQAHWTNVGAHDGDVLKAQALILAAWPRFDDRLAGVVALLDSPWEALEPAAFRHRRLSDWRSRALLAALAAPNEPLQPLESVEIPAFPDTPALTDPLGVTAPKDMISISIANAHFQHIGGDIAAWLGDPFLKVAKTWVAAIKDLRSWSIDAHSDITRLTAFARELAKVLPTTWSAIAPAVNAMLASHSRRQEVLWWGQARYSHRLGMPYRKLNPSEMLWWTAFELAERTGSLPAEPAAAYLVETLHALGQVNTRPQPLFQWLQGLEASFRGAPELGRTLASLVDTEPLGLPISWMRRRAADRRPLDPEGFQRETLLQPEAAVDRDTFATWVFRETLLDLRLTED